MRVQLMDRPINDELGMSRDDDRDLPAVGTAILAAALALPGVQAQAESAPEQGMVSVRYLDYEEWQPGLERISVRSPSVSIMAPVAGDWSVEGSFVSDDVSGASPRYHTAISGASRMSDHRKAADVKVTRYFPRNTITAGAAFSNEHDYRSLAVSLQGSISSEDNNTTWTAGIGSSRDEINPTNLTVAGEKKHTTDLLLGVTRVLTVRDIVQANLTVVRGRGYFSDPYKMLDNRPRERDQRTVLLRWNHHFDAIRGTSRASYRYYTDTFGIRAHTLGLDYVQQLNHGWTLTPSVRVYTQSAADFYYDAVYDTRFGAPFPAGYVIGSSQYTSPDQRLSAFGARTFGIKLEKQLTPELSIDIKLEGYRQRSGWRLFGSGSPGLAELSARSIQVGLTRKW